MPRGDKDNTLEVDRAERDAIVFLGLLAHMHVNWDPGIVPLGGDPVKDFTHFGGLNIHAAVVDNGDGSILSVDRNTIHRDGSPLQHAEQRAIRSAISVLSGKRPRDPGMTIEQHYRTRMFYEEGTTEDSFYSTGCTLYTTLQPCPMCAATSLVTRMKRVVYVVPDLTFGTRNDVNGYDFLHRTFYPADDLRCEQLAFPGKKDGLTLAAANLYDKLLGQVAILRQNGLRDTQLFDQLQGLLAEAFDLFRCAETGLLVSEGPGERANVTTLCELKTACGIPFRA